MRIQDTTLLDLWSHAPLSWAIIRKIEIELLRKEKFTSPILEVGCGDGLVSQYIFKNKHQHIDVGIDLDSQELARAEKTELYKKLLQEDITHSSFKKASFTTVFANGVLEHIPNLDSALSEISRILKKNGKLITTSPTDTYTHLLFYYRLFSYIGLTTLANWYGYRINTTFAHHHLYRHEIWKQKLKMAGLKLVSYTYYNNPNIIALHDLCLPFSMFTKTIKAKTDYMVLFPTLRKLLLPVLAPIINNQYTLDCNEFTGASVLLIAQKV